MYDVTAKCRIRLNCNFRTTKLPKKKQVVKKTFFSLSKATIEWGAFDSAKNHKRQRRKRQRRKRQSVTAKREKSQTPKFV